MRVVADAIAPAPDDATYHETVRNVRMEITMDRLSPQRVYEQGSTAPLAPPGVRAFTVAHIALLHREARA